MDLSRVQHLWCNEFKADSLLSRAGEGLYTAISHRSCCCGCLQQQEQFLHSDSVNLVNYTNLPPPPPPSPALLQFAIVLTDSCSLAISLCVWVVACIHVGVHACIMYFVHACMCACQECVCVHASMCVRMLGTLFWAEKNQCIIASCKHSLFVMTIWSLRLWSVLVSKCRLKMTVHSMYVTLNFDTESYSLHTQKLSFSIDFCYIYI